ncbi:MAG: hypothetical protein JXA91_02770 [Candidatus Thermoplasmatota archaeon]|nr:hypothetical protein [Candidatus Thermoplasmatota archaeon]
MSKKDSEVSKLLEMAIKRYQFDVVGWTKFCTENKISVKKALPSGKPESLELLRIQDKISKPLSIPSIRKIYDSKSNFIKWLDEEYVRDQAFYEAILKNPGKYKLGLEDDLLNEEIDNSAREYLEKIRARRVEEKSLIRNISDEKWDVIKVSKYPKVLLGLMLGASEEDIVNNFGLYFVNLLKAHFAGGRTAFLSSSGPEYWHEIDKCKAELTYFKEEVIRPSLNAFKSKKIN